MVLSAIEKLAPSSHVGNGVAFGQPTSDRRCTELISVPVNLRKHGQRPGKLQIRTVAFGTRKRVRDVDRIRLVCMP
jgi:hypothetical protein